MATDMYTPLPSDIDLVLSRISSNTLTMPSWTGGSGGVTTSFWINNTTTIVRGGGGGGTGGFWNNGYQQGLPGGA